MKKVLVSILILVLALFCLSLATSPPEGAEPADGTDGHESVEAWRQLVEKSAQLRQRGLHDQGIGTLREALAAAVDEHGPDHPIVAYVMYTLGTTYLMSDNMEAARPMLERSLRIREQVFGPDHPDVAAVVNNLGALHERQGNLDEAIPLFERSLAIWEHAFPADHPVVVGSRDRLAKLHRDAGQPEEEEN